jgi:hypothetical protein
MKKICLLFLMIIFIGLVYPQANPDTRSPQGKIVRDTYHYIPVIAWYDSATGIIYNVNQYHPLPVATSGTFYSDTASVVRVMTAQNITLLPARSFSIQVVAVGGTVTAWTVAVQASLDGVTYTTILSHTQADGDAVTKFTGASFYPARYFRANVTALTLNTATMITVNVLAE